MPAGRVVYVPMLSMHELNQELFYLSIAFDSFAAEE